ncbi:hypothetical protein N5853_02810 [Bartonella sp. HY329]|uniref:hypothetical protein n=1 Tax=unclassified Bartonella TaxID=2645622 RepID=UPI0021C83B15|nr:MULTISPECIES: hypothetical protein [unclassified Bartonella]UXM95579.1 hypothetical protein N5853_02810 [Bartonella sp. HY329]UXN09904.1 hypothetical protein N5852_02820 [Bartonella sp. HY328]
MDRYVKHIKDQAYLMYEKYNNIDNIIKLYDNGEFWVQYLVMNMYTKNYKKVCDMIKSTDGKYFIKDNVQVGIEAYLKNHELC